MRKIEKPEDVVVVSRRELMRLSSLAAAGSVVFGALELGKTERGYSLGRGAAADPGDSDAAFGGAETAATTGWEIIAAWLALTTRSDKLTGYKMAWMLWPDSGSGKTYGEIDFPERNLDSPNVFAFMLAS